MSSTTRYAHVCNSGMSVIGVTNLVLVRFKVHSGGHPPPILGSAGATIKQESLAGRKTSMGLPSTLRHQAGGPHNAKQLCDGEMGDKEKQNGPCVVERHRKEEMKTVRSGLVEK